MIDDHKVVNSRLEFVERANTTENELIFFSLRGKKKTTNSGHDSWAVYRFALVHIFLYGWLSIILYQPHQPTVYYAY